MYTLSTKAFKLCSKRFLGAGGLVWGMGERRLKTMKKDEALVKAVVALIEKERNANEGIFVGSSELDEVIGTLISLADDKEQVIEHTSKEM